MPDTFQALAVITIALLPGALYVWAFERQAGRWGIGFSDRALRFVGGSALLLEGGLLLRWEEVEHLELIDA